MTNRAARHADRPNPSVLSNGSSSLPSLVWPNRSGYSWLCSTVSSRMWCS